MAKYYEAYDKRYRQVHAEKLSWASDASSPIVKDIIERYSIGKECSMLELGCGEGRDALPLLNEGYDLLATDISPEAVDYCIAKDERFRDNFRVLNACVDTLDQKFDFIYAVAVIHMLVLQSDRDAFLRFIKNHLTENGLALILTQGDGESEYTSDPSAAFDDVLRTHGETGRRLSIASTTYKMVGFPSFEKELTENGFELVEKGMTSIYPDFPTMMYALVK